MKNLLMFGYLYPKTTSITHQCTQHISPELTKMLEASQIARTAEWGIITHELTIERIRETFEKKILHPEIEQEYSVLMDNLRRLYNYISLEMTTSEPSENVEIVVKLVEENKDGYIFFGSETNDLEKEYMGIFPAIKIRVSQHQIRSLEVAGYAEVINKDVADEYNAIKLTPRLRVKLSQILKQAQTVYLEQGGASTETFKELARAIEDPYNCYIHFGVVFSQSLYPFLYRAKD